MRILGFNGSPRKYGNTAKLLYLALKAAEEEGAETKVFHLYDYRIEPCLGCLSDEQLACRYPCVIEDDMKQLYDEILEADGFIIATPIYWYAPSGVTKNFIDRLTAFENMIFIEGRSLLEGKVAGLIAVGNDVGAIQLLSTLGTTLNTMGMLLPPWSVAYYSEKGEVLENEQAVLDALNVGRALALAVKEEHIASWYSTKYKERLDDLKRNVFTYAEEMKRKQFSERWKAISRLLEER